MIATAHRAGTTHAIHRAMAGTIRATIRVRRCRQYRRVHPVRRDRLFPSRSSAPRIMADRGIRIVTTGGGHVMATTGTTSTSSERRRRVSSGARRLRRNPSGQCGVEGETKPPRSSGYGIGLRGHAVWLRHPGLDARIGCLTDYRAAAAFEVATGAATVDRLRQGPDAVTNLFSGRSKPHVGLEISGAGDPPLAADQAARRARSVLSLRPAALSTPLAPSSAPATSSSARKRSRS